MMRPLCATLVWTACALAQTAPAPSFEVASVKPAAPVAGKGGDLMRSAGDPGRIDYSNSSLRDLIRQAYRLKDYQIVGPEWLGSERYDVMAKAPEGTSAGQKWVMLQNLLAERFHMQFHREKRDLPAYALVIAKGGPKLKEHVDSPEDSAGGPSENRRPEGYGGTRSVRVGPDGMPAAGRAGMMMMGMGRMIAYGVPLGTFVDMLSRQLDKPVVDESGLTAKYDIVLRWAPEPGDGPMVPMGKMMARDGAGAPPPGGGADGRGPDAAAASLPPLPVAIQQQLGLRLEPKKLPLEILVIDHAEKVPTEN